MDNVVDARKKACPIPVIMAKKEADKGKTDFIVRVDNKTAVENLMRLGKNLGFDMTVAGNAPDDFSVRLTKSGQTQIDPKIGRGVGSDASVGAARKEAANPDTKNKWAVFIGKEGIGNGDPELGTTLMKMYFYTLAQGTDIPSYVLFMNEGVKVPVSHNQAIEHLEELISRGTEVLVCGACLNYYKLADDLKVGTVSNMYDIVEAMQAVDKVITL